MLDTPAPLATPAAAPSGAPDIPALTRTTHTERGALLRAALDAELQRALPDGRTVELPELVDVIGQLLHVAAIPRAVQATIESVLGLDVDTLRYYRRSSVGPLLSDPAPGTRGFGRRQALEALAARLGGQLRTVTLAGAAAELRSQDDRGLLDLVAERLDALVAGTVLTIRLSGGAVLSLPATHPALGHPDELDRLLDGLRRRLAA